MWWDPDSGEWLAENRGLNEHGLPGKGEPGSFGLSWTSLASIFHGAGERGWSASSPVFAS